MGESEYMYCCHKCGYVMYFSYEDPMPEEYECKFCSGVCLPTGIKITHDEWLNLCGYYSKSNKQFEESKTKRKAFHRSIQEQYCLNQPEFDQSAWNRRERSEGTIDEPHPIGTVPVEVSIPHCPTCNSTNVCRISGLERGVSIAMLGLFSKKINKSFKCNACGYTW